LLKNTFDRKRMHKNVFGLKRHFSRKCTDTYSLFTWSKQKWLFWRAGFFPANQRELFEYFFNCSDWQDKSRPCKKATFVL